jgi:mono/diheme cytochrome c family protein
VRIIMAAALAAMLFAPCAAATDNVANGKQLYNGSAPGSYACSQCHNVNDTKTEQNLAFRGAANDPSLIAFAINSNPDSVTEMRPLYGIGMPFELSDSDLSDLAAYIGSVINPGGGGTATFSATPSSLDFGTVAVGAQSATKSFTIKVGGAAGSVSSVSSSNNVEFLLAGGTCLATPVSLAQDGTCTLQVIFAPGVGAARSSTITLTNNGVPNPLTISVTGTGGASAPAQGNLTGPGSAVFTSQVLFTQSAPKTLTFRNNGTLPVSVIALSSSNPTEFPLLGSSCGVVAAGATCTVSVAFDPSAPGPRAATLTIANDGATNPLSVQLSGTGAGGSPGDGAKVVVTEFYNAALDHYFIATFEAGELGKPPFQDWQPTGLTFNAYSTGSPPASAVAVCRFFNDHFLGISTHFYAPHGLGCEQTISGFPDWTLETTDLFNAMLPDAAGNCPSGQIPVYRLFNNGMGGAPNHRFTTDLAVRAQMMAKGYTPEGYGIGVGWCAPQ